MNPLFHGNDNFLQCRFDGHSRPSGLAGSVFWAAKPIKAHFLLAERAHLHEPVPMFNLHDKIIT